MQDDRESVDGRGTFDMRYRAFLETVSTLRPSLHRYCARMTGSALDGEDVVQEALFEAYRHLDTFDESRPLSSWLFRIAHNRSIDFLRHKRVYEAAQQEAAKPDIFTPPDLSSLEVAPAIERMVAILPPKERAAILLKEVFGYSLEETAKIIDSTPGGVKAALSRARAKLAARPASPNRSPVPRNHADLQLIKQYVERFNQRDWGALQELISADVRLRVADRFDGRISESGYFRNYERWSVPWRLAMGELDGEDVVVILHPAGTAWTPSSVVHLKILENSVRIIRDYAHCSWMIQNARSFVVNIGPEVGPYSEAS